MALVKVPEKRENEMLADFFNRSMFTFEGIDIKSKEGRGELKKFEDAIRKDGGYDVPSKKAAWYWFTGDVMNKHFRLTEDNAYPDDTVFLVIPDFYNVLYKQASGARWFDDIVASNSIKQNAQDTGLEPDFQ